MVPGAIRIRLRGHLWRHEPLGRSEVELPWQGGKTVGELLSCLGVPEDQVMVILVSGKRQCLSYHPSPGDDIEVLPIIDGG